MHAAFTSVRQFDQYPDFEAHGDHFKQLVEQHREMAA